MNHTFELSPEAERQLSIVAMKNGQSESDWLREQVSRFLLGNISRLSSSCDAISNDPAADPQPAHAIQHDPEVMGGDACIRRTRIPVWQLIQYKRQGSSDEDLLNWYPGISRSDLIAAWDYFALNPMEIEQQIQSHENA